MRMRLFSNRFISALGALSLGALSSLGSGCATEVTDAEGTPALDEAVEPLDVRQTVLMGADGPVTVDYVARNGIGYFEGDIELGPVESLPDPGVPDTHVVPVRRKPRAKAR